MDWRADDMIQPDQYSPKTRHKNKEQQQQQQQTIFILYSGMHTLMHKRIGK